MPSYTEANRIGDVLKREFDTSSSASSIRSTAARR